MTVSRNLTRWPATAVLLLMFGLALTSMAADSPTFDEQGFLVRGLAYLRGEDGGNRHIRVGHPLGLNALSAAFLVADPTVRLPVDDPSWAETSFHRPAELFLWEIGNDVEHIMFLARLPTIWLGLLLAAVGGRWAAQMAAGWREGAGGRASIAGLIALLLLAFDPNVLAHTRLVTTDLGLAAAAALAGYTLWRFLRRPSWVGAALAGAGLGLLLNTKFTALLFLPLFAIVILLGLVRLEAAERRRAAAGLVIYSIVAFLTLWAGHGFQVGPLRAPLPIPGSLGGAAVPLSDYLDQLLDIGARLAVATPSFLLGRYSDSGWWYYFPVVFLLKTPLPTLLLLGWAFARVIGIAARPALFRERWFDLAALLIPAAGFFAIALTTEVNLGYRHLLPILPFLYVLIGVVIGRAVAERQARPAAVLLGWLVVVSLWIYPHYLAFFNLLAGGPDNGWRALVDSNLDWGQDLGRLADWLTAHDVDRVWLSYFGEGRPEQYGINYDGLDSFPPRLMNPAARLFYPPDPAPGWYAISATTLQGVHFADHDQFAVFRERRPAAKIGYSIFLYEQPARGAPLDLLLGGVQVDAIDPEAFAQLGTNDVALRWFDPTQAVVVPGGDRPAWLALGDLPHHPLLEPYLDFNATAPTAAGDNYRLYRATPRPPGATAVETLTDADGHSIAFIGAPAIRQDGVGLTVVTAWRQKDEPRPVKLFIHLLDESGDIAAQWDGLGAAWEGWRDGDTLIQVSELAPTAPGEYRLVAGLYDPENLQRRQSTSGRDVIELGTVTVP